LEHRTVISTAVGITMARYSLTSAVAFDLLRRLSAHGNTKLYKIATIVVDKTNEQAGGL
jgi:AmiR/NasT family two-component response regulator